MESTCLVACEDYDIGPLLSRCLRSVTVGDRVCFVKVFSGRAFCRIVFAVSIAVRGAILPRQEEVGASRVEVDLEVLGRRADVNGAAPHVIFNGLETQQAGHGEPLRQQLFAGERMGFSRVLFVCGEASLVVSGCHYVNTRAMW